MNHRRLPPSKGSGISGALAPLGMVGLAGLGAIGFGVLALEMGDDPQLERRWVIGLDSSETYPSGARCEALQRISTEALKQLPNGGASLYLVSTGDQSTGWQMKTLEVARLTHRSSAFGQSGANTTEVEDLRARLDSACAALTPLGQSPIKETIEGALSLVRTGERPCSDPEVECEVHVATDGVDNRDPALRQAWGWDKAKKGKTQDPLEARPLDNSDVTVVLCDLTMRVVGGKPGSQPVPSMSDLAQAWSPHFTHPERVRFEAVCSPTAE